LPRFFTSGIGDGRIVIDGADAVHIGRTLRMRPGETLTVCDGAGTDYACVIEAIHADFVELCIESASPSVSEPALALHLYVGMPKADKAEHIVQKAVELGAASVSFFDCRFCVSKPSDFEKRRVRLERVALEAAKQSGRGRIPEIGGLYRFDEMLAQAGKADLPIFFYEGGGETLRTVLARPFGSCALITGPEGGFAPEEVEKVQSAGIVTATLGPRILRCETAPLCAASAVLFHAGAFD